MISRASLATTAQYLQRYLRAQMSVCYMPTARALHGCDVAFRVSHARLGTFSAPLGHRACIYSSFRRDEACYLEGHVRR